MSFADAIKGIEIPEAVGRNTDLPRIWWHNGAKAPRPSQPDTPGDFYTKQSEFAGGLTAPWAQEERFTGETGYATSTLRIAVLSYRQQAFRSEQQPGEKYPRKIWLTRWEQGAKLYTELLCFVEGYNDIAVWASDGLTGKAVSGKQGILKTYEQGLLAEAERIAASPLPLWTFWLPIATKRNGDKIAYEDTGYNSFVTPPALHLPPDPLDVLFVGDELLQRGAAIMRQPQYTKWTAMRRLPENVLEGEVVNVPMLPAPRNVPVAISALDDSEI